MYRYPSEGFALAGYSLPAEPVTDTLPVTLWWSAEQRGHRDLTQYVHLIPRSAGDPVVQDRQPFDGNLPTGDWQPGMTLPDSWTLSLDAAPNGLYDVYIGFYDPATLERAAVVDKDGQPAKDNEIYLGTIEHVSAS